MPKASYEYIPQGADKKKSYKDEEGAVIIGPRNFTTKPLRRGKIGVGTTFGGSIPFLGDDYDAKKKILRKEIAVHQSKLQDKPWSQKAKLLPFGTFNKPKEVFGHVDMPARRNQTMKKVNSLPAIHDYSFKPCGPGKKNKTLAKFPLFMPDPPKQLKRKIVPEGQEDIPAFRPNTKIFSRPTPSVVTNFRNIRSAFPSAFRR